MCRVDDVQGERTLSINSFSMVGAGGAAVESSLDDFHELNITNEDDEVRLGTSDGGEALRVFTLHLPDRNFSYITSL